jgi:hypothetical protein
MADARFIGARLSAARQQQALRRWALRVGLDIGQGQGYAGWSLFIDASTAFDLQMFVIEHRGPNWPSIRITDKFLRLAGSQHGRQIAFQRMVTLFLRLTAQTMSKPNG